MTANPSTEGIQKVWQFFKQSFTDRPNPQKGSSLTAFRAEWEELTPEDKEQIRTGLNNASHTY